MAGNANSGRKAGFHHNETTRDRIKAAHIIRRLEADFDRRSNSKTAPLTDAQIKIGFGLLRKVLPDLQSTALTGPEGGPIQTSNVVVNVDPEKAKSLLKDILG